MRTVLVIAYYFPPEGGPAVQRTLKFVKYLKLYGYQSVVITSKHFAKIIDKSLLKDIPLETKIYRLFDIGAALPGIIRKLIYGKNYIDKQQVWSTTTKYFAGKIIRKNKIDIIFSTTPPHSANLLAAYLSNKYNLPWVADFRDEWTRDPNFGKQKNKNHLITLEENTLRKANAISTVTLKGKDNFAKIVHSDNKTICIHNGFDPDDYLHLKNVNRNSSKNLSIIYTGRLTKKSSPEFLFQVLESLLNERRIDFSCIKFTIVGPEGNKKWIQKYNHLINYVEFVEYQPHFISSQMLFDADVLLLLATNTPDSEVFTGKVFEYFYMRKPILAIIRYQGELSTLLSMHGNSYIGIESIQNSVKDAFLNMYHDFLNNKLNKNIDQDFISTFNRQGQAKQLAKIFDSILSGENH